MKKFDEEICHFTKKTFFSTLNVHYYTLNVQVLVRSFKLNNIGHSLIFKWVIFWKHHVLLIFFWNSVILFYVTLNLFILYRTYTSIICIKIFIKRFILCIYYICYIYINYLSYPIMFSPPLNYKQLIILQIPNQ